jgi:hypothetical protein
MKNPADQECVGDRILGTICRIHTSTSVDVAQALKRSSGASGTSDTQTGGKRGERPQVPTQSSGLVCAVEATLAMCGVTYLLTVSTLRSTTSSLTPTGWDLKKN